MNVYNYSFPTKILFAAGVLARLSDELKNLEYKNIFLATDKDLVKLPVFEKVKQALEEGGHSLTIFSEIQGNPLKSQAEKGSALFKESRCDAIVAVGGGAALDISKALAVLVNHEGDLFDYEDVEGAKPIDNDLPFIAAIPTTAGTGSEVGRSAVVSDDKTKIKKIIFSAKLLPSLVLLDPTLTVSLPAKITAATGVDAITHLIEAYLARGYHPLCDAIALHGLTLASNSLKKCVDFSLTNTGETPEHLEARADMLHASMMGAIAFQKGLGANHSMAHALSTVFDFHHGLANAIVLPFVMAFNAKAVPEKFEALERAVLLEASGGKNFIQWLKQLNKEIGIPEKLSMAGASIDKIDSLVDVAFNDVCHSLNPCVVSKEDFKKLFSEAM